MDINEYKIFVEQLLKQAGKIALKYFRNKDIDIKSKNDGSLVTIADKEIEQFIIKEISKKYKNHSILGEEFGLKQSTINNRQSKHLWVIDPIDGTASFSAGRPMWGIMIGLMIDNYPALGAVYSPFTDEMWVGYGQWSVVSGQKFITSYNGKKIQTTNHRPQTTKILATTSPDLFDKKGEVLFNKLSKKADNAVYGGDCYNFCLLANGHIHTIYEQNLKIHDYIPLLPILWGAGAKVTDEKGKEITNFPKEQSLLVVKG